MVEFWQRQLRAVEGYLELGMFEEADECLRALPEADRPRVEVRQMTCTRLLQAARWSEAAGIARELTETHPDDSQNWINLAYAVRRYQSIEQAEQILLEALSHHPTEWGIHYNLACYASVQGATELANVRLERALQLQPACRAMATEDPDLKALWLRLGQDDPD